MVQRPTYTVSGAQGEGHYHLVQRPTYTVLGAHAERHLTSFWGQR